MDTTLTLTLTKGQRWNDLGILCSEISHASTHPSPNPNPTHTECECSCEPVPMFLTTRVIVLHHFPYLGPADKGLLYTFPTSKRLFSCARAPTRGTSWAESGILFYEPDVLHSSYPVMSSHLFTTTTYGCLHVERITACHHFFYTYT